MLPKHQAKRNAEQKRLYHRPDFLLIAGLAILVLTGLICLSSATTVIAYSKFKDAYYYFNHQLFGLGLGLIGFFFFANTDYRYFKNHAIYFLFGSVALLLLVFIPGLSADWGTSNSWINVFGFSLQPSELVKISFLIYLAAWLEIRREELSDLNRGIGPFIGVMGLIALLLLLQPDLGTLSILIATSLMVYFVGGGRIKHIVIIILVGIIAFFALIQMKPYQKDRIRCVIDPSYSSSKVCYQINQSLIAIGSGGLWGRGLGESRQKYLYLPEVNGDSIFAVIAEELGLVFSSLIIALYMFIFYRGYWIAKHAPDLFGQNLAIGIVSWICFQALINIGGISNLIPMTGVPLPLISYGGSAILAALAACGILVNISRQTK